MSEKEKKIMETLARVVKGAPENRKDYLLGWAEGAAAMFTPVADSDSHWKKY